MVCVLCLVSQSCLILCNPMGCSPPGSSVHGDLPGKNTGLGCHALIQEVFPTQGLNPGLPCCRWILYHLSHQGSPRILEWVAYPCSRGSSQPRNWTRVILYQLSYKGSINWSSADTNWSISHRISHYGFSWKTLRPGNTEPVYFFKEIISLRWVVAGLFEWGTWITARSILSCSLIFLPPGAWRQSFQNLSWVAFTHYMQSQNKPSWLLSILPTLFFLVFMCEAGSYYLCPTVVGQHYITASAPTGD